MTTTIHAGDCSTGCLECAYACANRRHVGCTGGELRTWADERVAANAPARVRGDYGSALVLFEADNIGDLVDIDYLCRDCAGADMWAGALEYPDWPFVGECYCCDCGERID